MKKDWIARELTIEVIIGVFIVMVLLGLTYFTFVLKGRVFGAPEYSMKVRFYDVMGLRVRDDVICRGMPVGEIKSLELDEGGKGVHVHLTLNKQLHMKVGYKITVVSTSILGGRNLQIYEGFPENNEIDLDEYYGEKPHDLMADAADLVNAAKEGLTDEDGIIANLKSATAQMREITDRLNSGKGTLGKLLSEDDQLYEDLSATVSSLKNIAARIEKGEGVMGQLIQDDTLYVEVQQAIKEIRAAVDDFRETAPITTFTSVFFGAF